MAPYIFEGYTRLWWATSIASKTGPTTAEIAAGTELTSYIAKDGIRPGIDQNMVDNATIAETFDAKLIGSWGGDFELEMRRDVDTDTAWDLCVQGTNGFIVIRYGIAIATAVANGQQVEVWPAQMGQPFNKNSAANEQVRFIEKFAITSAPALSATVGGS